VLHRNKRESKTFMGLIHRWLVMMLLAVCIIPSLSVGDDNPMIKFYQKHISSADGNRCPMTPSCSAYAAQAFKTHGPVMGWIMTCDRLMRCGRDESKIANKVIIDRQTYIHDPLEANNFWWFEKSGKNQ
jgi:putative component of membrane protein insertase Oxa1/YidC/SpoIIIJ protein YidD